MSKKFLLTVKLDFLNNVKVSDRTFLWRSGLKSALHWVTYNVRYILSNRRKIWSDHEDIDDVECEKESPPSSPDPHGGTSNSTDMVLVRWLLAFFLLLQANFHIADRVLKYIFVFIKTFFLVLG